MYELKHSTKQIFLSEQERHDTVRELEKIFILADDASPIGMYSSKNISKQYPLLSELFDLLYL